uniref:Col_cuticle_N domain-containing protein n=1 Tax=Angiostrongylus cantonensis TaxID=6313 RepID=A0A0K0DDL7_ANGCA
MVRRAEAKPCRTGSIFFRKRIEEEKCLSQFQVSAPRGFGIRSYLHNFYLSPTTEDMEQGGAWYLLPPPSAHRRGLFICRICTVIGLMLLIGGAISIIIGYTWPHEGIEQSIYKIVIYEATETNMDEDGGYYVPQDKLREMLRDPMKLWKTAGFCIFASGALLLAVSLMVPTLAACIGSKRLSGFISEDSSPNEPPVRIYPQEKPSVSHTSGPIPVLEEITKVQPGEKVAPSGVIDSDKAPLVH